MVNPASTLYIRKRDIFLQTVRLYFSFSASVEGVTDAFLFSHIRHPLAKSIEI